MIFLKKSFWAMLSIYMCLWLAISVVAGTVLDSYKNVINATLGLTGYRTETITTEGEDLEYFKSNYVKYNEDGTIQYVTDEDGYTHQVYDDASLRNDALAKADQVQREGTTILWNSVETGLPLEKGDKVSLFSRSTVDWVYSGGGSGNARTNGASDMKKALTNAGLSVNTTLWDFYKSGVGKDYVRVARFSMNEVPWSKYTDAVKNSFANYGDAAIIVLSRKAGEGSVAQGGAFDVTQTEADTLSGDYYDMSSQEKTMIEEVINLKKAGTFKKVIVLLNTATDMWLASLMEYQDDIDCCMWVGQTGYQGLNEVGKILVGASIPSGHLVNTFLMNTQSTPVFANSVAAMYSNANNFDFMNKGFQAMYVTYAEGIYVGYKYFETRYEDAVLGRGNATSVAGAVNSNGDWRYSEEVAFPFGYGASYTSFAYSNYEVVKNADGNYEITLTVKNTGNYKGADAVQVYVQKPYTTYDKVWGIEQAAVNLAGYTKTPMLEPGQSVEVKIIVRDDAFKTYDAYNKKTYIREKGDYYITVAQDSHEAVNNILAAKGYTPSNTDGVMDANGNSSLVKDFHFDNDDYETYSKSEVTGNAITNQFDDADWNLYANKTSDNVVFLSRNDWQATYPSTTTKLTMNQQIVDETRWNQTIEADPADKMPTFGSSHVFNLIDLKDKDFDDPVWDALLDQLTLDEMIKLLSTGYHGMKEVTSIAKPADITKDGPLGVRMKYLNSSQYTLSFPSTTLLAASYNDQLAYEVGELMGEDMMHAGVTGIYAPGANIHRSTYSGRNYEYYSEDGFISGIMCKQQTLGIQSKGCYVVIKHIVLNDQETNRHGINTWATEQAIREVYLPAFEYAVTEGGALGIMSGFNRIGTKWTGAHKGLLTDVLRGEWGYEGFVISDCAWRVFMDVEDGLLAGNDCILDNIDASNYNQVKNNPTLAKAVREATHRVLYVVANSNAMNGFSKNTRVYEVREWWQDLVTDIQTGIAIATVIVILITILMFILGSKLDFGGYSEGGIVSGIICIVLAVAILLVSVVVPIALAKEPLDLSGILGGESTDEGGEVEGETEAPSLKDQLEGDLNTYIFEAECSEISTTIASLGAGIEDGMTVGGCNYPSGDAYVYFLSREGEATLTFNVHSSTDTKAVLSLCMGRNVVRYVNDLFTIKVNGTACEIDSSLSFPAFEGVQYFDWMEKEIVIVDLKAGDNIIELTKVVYGMNFDYLALTSAATLQDSRDAANGGHKYSAWNIASIPTLESEGKMTARCENCRDYKTVTLPVISEANGYIKNVITPATATTFGEAKWTYNKDGVDQTFTTKLYPENVKSYTFEAESTKYDGTATRYSDSTVSAGAYLGKLAGATWNITLDIVSDKECDALIVMKVGRRNDRDLVMHNKTLMVNGEKVALSKDIVFPQIESSDKYLNWEEFEIVVVHLKEGKNTITLSNTGTAFTNIDYFRFVTAGTLSWYVEE